MNQPNIIRIVLFGKNNTGKTTLAYLLTNKNEPTTMTQNTKSYLSNYFSGKNEIQLMVVDTMGVGTKGRSWVRLGEFLSQLYIIIILISSDDKQSFQDAKEIIDICLEEKMENKNSKVFALLNVKENNTLNKDDVIKYLFEKNIQILQLKLIPEDQNDSKAKKKIINKIMSTVIQRQVISTSNVMIPKLKVCIIGTKNSNKNIFYQRLTGENIRKLQGIVQKSIQARVGNNSVQINLKLCQDFDFNRPSRFTNLWKKIGSFQHYILVTNLSCMQDDDQYNTNKELIDVLKDRKQKNKLKSFSIVRCNIQTPIISHQQLNLSHYSSYKFQHQKNDRTSYQVEGFPYIQIENFDQKSSFRCLQWSLQNFIMNKLKNSDCCLCQIF